MHPYLGNQDWLSSYGLLMIIGLAVCWWLARRAAVRAGIDPSHIDLALPLVFIVGAACLSLLTGPRIRLYPLIFGCTGALFAYGAVAKLSFRALLDIFALPTIAAIAIQRIGCFLAGCCWGDVAVHDGWLDVIARTGLGHQLQTLPWATGDWVVTAVQFPAGSLAWQQHLAVGLITADALVSLPVHPTQLYESALLLLVIPLLLRLGRREMPAGSLAMTAFIAYAVVRFGIEFLRADNVLFLGNLTLPQVTSAVLFGAASLLLTRNLATRSRPGSG
jgi:phosphatidylglycerol:prolipoprotein diacylglycerol transferase